MGPYVRIGIRELFRYRADTTGSTLDGEEIVSDALVIAFANGREYGNRIRVAPQALVDDGKLEAVVVEDRDPLSRLWGGRHLALGTVDRAPRRLARPIESATIETDGEIALSRGRRDRPRERPHRGADPAGAAEGEDVL